jgi:hypothetical protein
MDSLLDALRETLMRFVIGEQEDDIDNVTDVEAIEDKKGGDDEPVSQD